MVKPIDTVLRVPQVALVAVAVIIQLAGMQPPEPSAINAQPGFAVAVTVRDHCAREGIFRVAIVLLEIIESRVYKEPAVSIEVVSKIMKEVVEDMAKEQIYEDSSLSEAMHQMVQLHVLSLVVSNRKEITGLIRLADLFEYISNYIFFFS